MSGWKLTRAGVREAYTRVVGEVEDDLLHAKAGLTWMNYSSCWGLFSAWCAEHGREPLPTSADTLKTYVREQIKAGKSAATIECYVSAIIAAHRARGLELSRAPIRELMRAARRRRGRQRRARPLMAEELRGLLSRLDRRNPRDVRDGCMLVLDWAWRCGKASSPASIGCSRAARITAGPGLSRKSATAWSSHSSGPNHRRMKVSRSSSRTTKWPRRDTG